jgi:ParB/RepB/Spo0J family partition protein
MTVIARTEQKSLPMAEIQVDEAFNLREHYDDIVKLSMSIKTDGLDTPFTVRELKEPLNGFTHALVSGFRRWKALKEAGLKGEVPVVVKKFATEVDAKITNLTENTARESIHPAECAKRVYELIVKDEVERKDLAQRTNISLSHIGNLFRAVRDVAPDIVRDWRKHNIPLDIMLEWAALEGKPKEGEEPLEAKFEAQREAFEEWKSAQEKSGKSGKKRKKNTRKGSSAEGDDSERRTKSELSDMLETLESRLSDGEMDKETTFTCKGKVAGVKYALGQLQRL